MPESKSCEWCREAKATTEIEAEPERNTSGGFRRAKVWKVCGDCKRRIERLMGTRNPPEKFTIR
jgi:hypothetical protein